jgi:hypothetical protein
MRRKRKIVKFDSLSRRARLTLYFAATLLLLAAAPPRVNATAIANSSVQLTSLAITPASGSILFSPTAQSFAQAQNSLGELVTNFDSGTTASSSANVTWANAAGAADSASQTASAAANVDLPVQGAASSVGRGTLYDLSFSITGVTGPVSVQFNATLPYSQSLMTDAVGLQATSEVIFDLTIDGQTVLFLDSPQLIGSSSSFSISGSPTLSNSMTLTAGQTYDLYLELDAESSGINAPEPATLSLLLGGTLLSIVRSKLQS